MLRCLSSNNDYNIGNQKWHMINNEFIYGRFCFCVRGTTDTQIFFNNDLLSYFCLECRFKRSDFKYSDLQFGFSFKEEFKDIPKGMSMELLKSCIEMTWPEFKKFDLQSSTPTLMHPLALFCDRMHIEDNMNSFSIFHSEFTYPDFPTCKDNKSRNGYLSPRIDEMFFKKDKIYTFISHQNILDLSKKHLNFGNLLQMDLTKHLSQPIPLCLMLQGNFIINGQYLRNEEEALAATEFKEFQSAEEEDSDLIILT